MPWDHRILKTRKPISIQQSEHQHHTHTTSSDSQIEITKHADPTHIARSILFLVLWALFRQQKKTYFVRPIKKHKVYEHQGEVQQKARFSIFSAS